MSHYQHNALAYNERLCLMIQLLSASWQTTLMHTPSTSTAEETNSINNIQSRRAWH